MAPKYRVHYFNITALGEPIRYLLAYGNLDWEDVRYEPEEWAKAKSSTYTSSRRLRATLASASRSKQFKDI